MKILAKKVTEATQIHNGKCHFIGIQATNAKVYNMESGGTAADGNMVFDADQFSSQIMLPKPGIECSNGLYVSNKCVIYYSI